MVVIPTWGHSHLTTHNADTNPAYNANGEYTAPILLFAFLIGINEGFTIGSAIDAGVSTIFVGLGEDPMCVRQFLPPYPSTSAPLLGVMLVSGVFATQHAKRRGGSLTISRS